MFNDPMITMPGQDIAYTVKLEGLKGLPKTKSEIDTEGYDCAYAGMFSQTVTTNHKGQMGWSNASSSFTLKEMPEGMLTGDKVSVTIRQWKKEKSGKAWTKVAEEEYKENAHLTGSGNSYTVSVDPEVDDKLKVISFSRGTARHTANLVTGVVA